MQAYERDIERNERPCEHVDSSAAGTDSEEAFEVSFESIDPVNDGRQLSLAVEIKMRDNLALGDTLVRIGVLQPQEMRDVRLAQASGEDLCESLMLVSSIRSRLGEMLLRSNRITSEQLEFALETQRKRGGLLGEILVNLGWLDRATLDATLVAQRERSEA